MPPNISAKVLVETLSLSFSAVANKIKKEVKEKQREKESISLKV